MERDRCKMGAAVTVRHPLPVRSPVGTPISARSTTDTREILRNSPSLMDISREKVPPESPNPSIGSVQIGLCGGSAPHEPLVHSVSDYVQMIAKLVQLLLAVAHFSRILTIPRNRRIAHRHNSYLSGLAFNPTMEYLNTRLNEQYPY